ncbi:ABC transporter ATP-binding protein [Salipiger mucosus]|uniref:Glycerol-3-phosphate ABC transporter, ATP-binding protein UgpC n=1 Tax=Salipiger mucosus DSM 16094 TaxID=1123237 RepID=S9QR70_9RHOB|nr:sn-glycerol-3-phosphate ABC transporter ATP-binding protein UgpC [Salipiger mucosus]EPX83911.1 Glycerol-3-phosphate ABC transporter, ATP-binding protein UgpC [Salipiger mucosus DSM 16094]
MSGVKLTNVRKSFGGHDVIRDVSLEVPKGDFGVFVGPSGCGKSTLLRMIAGLEETSGGKIEIGGRNVTAVEPAQRGVAMVFQSYALYPHLSVAENMGFSLRLSRAPRAEREEKVREAARILQLTDHLDKKPSALSGGQRQRVAIGRAIVREPDVFLFDEPLSNLDAELRVQMRLELTRLHRQIGATMIYVTHDQVEAMTLADDIFVLKGGHVMQSGRPLSLYDDPDNRFVAGFIGSPAMNFVDAVVSDSDDSGFTARAEEGELRVALQGPKPGAGTQLVLGVRPEHLEPLETGGLPVKVEVAEELGGNSYVHSRSASGKDIVFERRGNRESLEGRDLQLSAPADKVFAFTPEGERLR